MKELADASVLAPDDAFQLLEPVMDERQKREFAEHLDADFAYGVPGLARFRVNMYRAVARLRRGVAPDPEPGR